MIEKIVLAAGERKFVSKKVVKIQVADNLYENALDSIFTVKIEAKNEIGYLIRVDIISSRQSADDFISNLFEDIGRQINKRIIFQTDLHCNMLKITNKADILYGWDYILPDLRSKYKSNPKAISVLRYLDTQLRKGGSLMEEAMKNKGFYDMIFNGIIAHDFSEEKFVIHKNIPNFIETQSLPFVVRDYALETPVTEDGIQKWVRGVGKLNERMFDESTLRKKIRRITGNPIFPVKPVFNYEEAFRLHEISNEIVEVRQELQFTVDGYYANTYKNVMKEIID